MKNVLVSINCITYNHENYIANALDSFLMQKTNFKFEILIHDDASTDRTADIIRKYEKKYPDVIKPILQKENQQSQGVKKISYRFNHTRANGKYIAMCEGDDYWTDPYKLQKQVDYMEQNPQCTFCFHNGFVVNDTKEMRKRFIIPWLQENRKFYSNHSRKYTAGEIQLLGFIPTASYLFPKHVLDNPPEWFFEAPVGDNAMKLIASSYGYAYYMNEIMCVYRINVRGSSMDKWRKEDVSKEKINKRIIRCENFLNMLDNFDKWTNYKHAKEIDEAKKTWEIQLESEKSNKIIFRDDRYKEYFKRLDVKEKAKLYMKCYFPKVLLFLKIIRNKIRF